jgi:hypothetical protein
LQYLRDTIHWAGEHVGLTVGFTALTVVVAVASVLGVRWFLIHIPPDYFIGSRGPSERLKSWNPVARWAWLITKNILGALLVIAGVVMLFTPGQGILSLLLGITLLDIPGKVALERRIVSRPHVLPLINHMRVKAGKAPLTLSPA